MQSGAGVGSGWRRIAHRAEAELRQTNSAAEVYAVILPEGFLGLSSKPNSKHARSLLARFEAEAMRSCEVCLAPATLSAGMIVTVLCQDCRASWDA
jgi:hypothetical protein